METLGLILLIVGYIGAAIAGIWFLIVAFQEDVWWGLGCLFVPFVSLIFLFAHWEEAKRPFLAELAACVPLLLGTLMTSNG
jgi:hypothetical protein